MTKGRIFMQCFWRRRNSCVENVDFQTSSSSSSNGTVVRFGFLVQMADPLILGSVALAVDSVNGDDTILKGVKLDFFFERIHSEFHKVVFFSSSWVLRILRAPSPHGPFQGGGDP